MNRASSIQPNEGFTEKMYPNRFGIELDSPDGKTRNFDPVFPDDDVHGATVGFLPRRREVLEAYLLRNGKKSFSALRDYSGS